MKQLFILAFSGFLFLNCTDSSSSKKKVNDNATINYKEQGQKIASATFASLGSNLQKAMKAGDVSHAVKYCNIAADPLVDSLEQVYKVKIKRTSLKERNPNNKPSEQEKEQLEIYQKQFEAGEDLKPKIHKLGDQSVFNAPIYVMPLCLNCHGSIGNQLEEKDNELIKTLYPTDRAINYKNRDLRGMWSISFYEPQADK